MILAKIDRDYINTDGLVTSRVGNHWTERHLLEYDVTVADLDSASIRFRLLDDDEIPYYGGWLHNDGECILQQVILEWAMRDSGCTIIEVRASSVDKWVREIG